MEWESNTTLETEPHVGDSVLLDRLAEAAADQPRMLAPAFGVNSEGAVSFTSTSSRRMRPRRAGKRRRSRASYSRGPIGAMSSTGARRSSSSCPNRTCSCFAFAGLLIAASVDRNAKVHARRLKLGSREDRSIKVGADELVTGAEVAPSARSLPEPVGRTSVAIMWRWAEVEAWANRTGRALARAGSEWPDAP